MLLTERDLQAPLADHQACQPGNGCMRRTLVLPPSVGNARVEPKREIG